MENTTNDDMKDYAMKHHIKIKTLNLHLKNKQVITVNSYLISYEVLQDIVKDNNHSMSIIFGVDKNGNDKIICLPQGQVSYVDCKSEDVLDVSSEDELPF